MLDRTRTRVPVDRARAWPRARRRRRRAAKSVTDVERDDRSDRSTASRPPNTATCSPAASCRAAAPSADRIRPRAASARRGMRSAISPMPQLVDGTRMENSGTLMPAWRAFNGAPSDAHGRVRRSRRQTRRRRRQQAEDEIRLVLEVEEIARMHEHAGVCRAAEARALLPAGSPARGAPTDQPPSGSRSVSRRDAPTRPRRSARQIALYSRSNRGARSPSPDASSRQRPAAPASTPTDTCRR